MNPWINDKQMAEAVERMTEHMSSQTLMQINEQKYQYIRDGVPVTRVSPNGETKEVKARIINFEKGADNDFLCVRELKVYGSLYRRRADIVGFVNGIPLLFMELKITMWKWKMHSVKITGIIWIRFHNSSITMLLLFSVMGWRHV